jgi:hypothetical protein
MLGLGLGTEERMTEEDWARIQGEAVRRARADPLHPKGQNVVYPQEVQYQLIKMIFEDLEVIQKDIRRYRAGL